MSLMTCPPEMAVGPGFLYRCLFIDFQMCDILVAQQLQEVGRLHP